MALTFYPHPDDAQKGTLSERMEVIMDAAMRYKAVVLETSSQESTEVTLVAKKRVSPRDQNAAYNWEEIARVLREIRELPEIGKLEKDRKATFLEKLAEVYEVLRAAKMPKLEAVRLALISEANQLRGSVQVA
jgi:hypothetical protein